MSCGGIEIDNSYAEMHWVCINYVLSFTELANHPPTGGFVRPSGVGGIKINFRKKNCSSLISFMYTKLGIKLSIRGWHSVMN